jgi:hypothetical protein
MPSSLLKKIVIFTMVNWFLLSSKCFVRNVILLMVGFIDEENNLKKNE